MLVWSLNLCGGGSCLENKCLNTSTNGLTRGMMGFLSEIACTTCTQHATVRANQQSYRRLGGGKDRCTFTSQNVKQNSVAPEQMRMHGVNESTKLEFDILMWAFILR